MVGNETKIVGYNAEMEFYMLTQFLNFTGVVKSVSSENQHHRCRTQDRCLAGVWGEARSEHAKEKIKRSSRRKVYIYKWGSKVLKFDKKDEINDLQF